MMAGSRAALTAYRRRGVAVGGGWAGGGTNRFGGVVGIEVGPAGGAPEGGTGVGPIDGGGWGAGVGPNSGGNAGTTTGAGEPAGTGDAITPSVTGLTWLIAFPTLSYTVRRSVYRPAG